MIQRTELTIAIADYDNPQHGSDLINLLDSYARDDMGGGEGLPEATKRELIPRLKCRQDAISLIAYTSGQAIGLLNAFEGFSSFAARPLLNIHDVFVAPHCRGKGIASALFSTLEEIGKERGCVKITLEVLSNNTTAKKAYAKLGYRAYTLKEGTGEAVFWQKKIQ